MPNEYKEWIGQCRLLLSEGVDAGELFFSLNRLVPEEKRPCAPLHIPSPIQEPPALATEPPPLKAPSPEYRAPSETVKTPPLPVADRIEIAAAPQAKQDNSSSSQWRALLQKVAPRLHFHDKTLDDKDAKRIKEAYKERALAPTVALFVHPQLAPYKTFLKNLADAITSCQGNCRLIDVRALEKENKWENFLSAKQMRLILCTDQLLFTLPHLMTHYKELPEKRQRTLGGVPLVLLPDLSLYMKDPILKRSLCSVICQNFAT